MARNDVKEYIVCAAVHVDDGRFHQHTPANVVSGVVVCGLRHCNCFAIIRKFPFEEQEYSRALKDKTVQGFLTSRNRFVDRREAFDIARSANQLSLTEKHDPSDLLLSEDLY